MELNTVLLFLGMTTGTLVLCIAGTIVHNKHQKSYLKNSDFLLMENSGSDLCEKGQSIDVKHHYARPASWIVEVES